MMRKILRIFKSIYWRSYILRLALRWIPQPNLGDRVWHSGMEWTLLQGVRSPIWTLVNGDDQREVHERDFRKIRSLHNYWHSFRSGYRFYMTNWYSIWMREGIQDWMRGCNIWAGRRLP